MQILSKVPAALLAFGLVVVAGCTSSVGESSKNQTSETVSQQDHAELGRLFEEDQEDRSPSDPRTIDWKLVAPRDRARRERVKTLFSGGYLGTGNDYYRAAMVLQHGDVPDDFLLAHELAVAAIVKGNSDAAWLAAATQDRFLTNIGRPQRFGTQFKADGNDPWRLEPVDPTMTDELRKVMDVPSLEESKARVKELNETE